MLCALLSSNLARCEPWCSDPCSSLNGDVQAECGGCSASAGDKCFNGAQNFPLATNFNVALLQRGAGRVIGPTADVTDYEQVPLPMPQPSPRHCEVYACALVDGDDACADARPDCAAPRGHLRRLGEQFEAPLPPVDTHDVRSSPLNASTLWAGALSRSRPLVLLGGSADVTRADFWEDASLRAICDLEGGPWQV